MNKIVIDGRDVTCWEELEIKYLIANEKPIKRIDIAMQLYKQLKQAEKERNDYKKSFETYKNDYDKLFQEKMNKFQENLNNLEVQQALDRQNFLLKSKVQEL